jgi:hypothetical protein
MVLMADGTSKPIEEVQLGDWVWAYDPETGEEGPREVIALIVGQGIKQLVEIDVKNKACGCGPLARTLTATDQHPFWVPTRNEWVDAADLQKGDGLLTESGETVYVYSVNEQVVPFQTVYNLTIDGLHTYYVMAGNEPVLVHNWDQKRCQDPFRLQSFVDWLVCGAWEGPSASPLAASSITCSTGLTLACRSFRKTATTRRSNAFSSRLGLGSTLRPRGSARPAEKRRQPTSTLPRSMGQSSWRNVRGRNQGAHRPVPTVTKR